MGKVLLKMRKGVSFYKRLNEALLRETWFHGEISFEEAEARLALAEEVGSFLVRNVGMIYIFSFIGKFKHTTNIKHVKVPSARKASVFKQKVESEYLEESSVLKSEYQVIKYILNLGCKYFLFPVNRPKHLLLGNLDNSKIKENKNVQILKCKYCEILAKSKKGLTQHYKCHKLTFCETCKILILTNNLPDHKRKEKCNPTYQANFKCPTCEKLFKHQTSMYAHKKKCQVNFKCFWCEKPFRYEKKLRLHEIKVHKKRVPCDQCDKTFSNDSALNMHKQVMHGIDIIKSTNICRYSCPKCDYKTPLKKMIEKHLSKHKYHCENCPFFTNIKKIYQKHIKDHFHTKKSKEHTFVVGF